MLVELCVKNVGRTVCKKTRILSGMGGEASHQTSQLRNKTEEVNLCTSCLVAL